MPRVKDVFVFVGHEFMATLGVGISAAFVTDFSFATLRPLGSRLFSSYNASWLVTELPYFPMQIILGLWLGWSFRRRFQHHSMLWVWVLPFLILCYAVIAGPIIMLHPDSIIAQAGGGFSPLSHYFGRGCDPRDLCLDQLMFTMPFYASVAYALGALLARNAPPKINSFQRESTSEPSGQGPIPS
jgi:hypothetical protein